ncbi:MAG: hypothetical protein ACI861_002221 [Paracoccaceae bacterium]|jgi:hypothetical protein
MSDAKTPVKAETVSKKVEPTKTESPKTETVKTDAASTESKAVDSSPSKSAASPKSAAQSSISHFSSVSTPQYRSGWNNIFGTKGGTKVAEPTDATKSNLPTALELANDEIDTGLRTMLNTAFVDLTKKQGIVPKDANSSLVFEYTISCEIKEK